MTQAFKRRKTDSGASSLPTEVSARLYPFTHEGKDAVRGNVTFGPVTVDGIIAYKDTFTNDEGKDVTYIRVEFPAKKSKNINPNSGKPYNEYIVRPTEEARKKATEVVRQFAQELLDNTVVEDKITEWPYAKEKLRLTNPSKPPTLNQELLEAIESDKAGEVGKWISVGTYTLAGFEVSSTFLREKRIVVDEEGNEIQPYGDWRDFYVRFPFRKVVRKGSKEPTYYDYFRPYSKDYRDELTKAIFEITWELIDAALN